MPPQLRVFVSGDQTELRQERASVIIAVGNLMLETVAWETSGAASRTSEEWCREAIEKSDVYVGVFGLRYSEPSCNEFLLASNKGIPRLVFIRLLRPSEIRDSELEQFVQNQVKPRLRYENFSTSQDLQVRVERALAPVVSKTYKVSVRHRTGLSVLDQSLIEAVEIKEVAFLREMQLLFEDQSSHWAVNSALKKLVERDLIRTNPEWHLRWFYSRDRQWIQVSQKARAKADMVGVYASHDNSFHQRGIFFDDYSEFLVEQALIQAGFVIEARNTRSFRGRQAVVRQNQGAGRPPDLDLVASLQRRHVLGVQVKNRLDYPEASSIRDFLSICNQLNVRPLLAVRMAPEYVLNQITESGGRFIVFKRWLLKPPFPRETFNQMQETGFPVSVYQRVPDFLVTRTRELAKWLDTQPTNSTGTYTI